MFRLLRDAERPRLVTGPLGAVPWAGAEWGHTQRWMWAGARDDAQPGTRPRPSRPGPWPPAFGAIASSLGRPEAPSSRMRLSRRLGRLRASPAGLARDPPPEESPDGPGPGADDRFAAACRGRLVERGDPRPLRHEVRGDGSARLESASRSVGRPRRGVRPRRGRVARSGGRRTSLGT